MRVPPPSKGELRAQIEKLETANAALKGISREANRAAKAAARRITELEEQVARFQEEAVEVVAPVASVEEATTKRRGRPPGSKKAIEPGDAAPPGVDLQEPEPPDAEVEAACEVLEKKSSIKQTSEGE